MMTAPPVRDAATGLAAAEARLVAVTEQLIREVVRAASEMHDLHAVLYPRRHWGYCRACNPRGNPPPLAADGHDYQRRARARQRRKKG